jgi:hypothetical protein
LVRWSGETLAAPAVHEDRELLASVALNLVRDFPRWVRRRVERITYVADTTVRRQMSVDFVLPRSDESDPSDPMGRVRRDTAILVPLWLPLKEPLTHFDVWDESGRSLSVLNTRENGDLATRALKQLVHSAGLRRLSDEQADAVRSIASDSSDRAQETLRAAIADWLGQVFDEGDYERVLFSDLSKAFMLTVPLLYVPAQHRVIKFAYDEPLDWIGTSTTKTTRRSRTLVTLGLRDKSQSLSHAIGLSESYHVEIVAPEEVMISDAFMSAMRWAPPDQTHAARVQVDPEVSVAEQHERAHLNVSILAPLDESEKSRADTATVVYTLRAVRSGTFRVLFVVTALNALLLLGVLWRAAEIDVTTAAAVLLVFPAVAAAYLARPGEHAFATRLLLGVRVAALTAGICSLLVAGMLGGGLLRARVKTTKPAVIRCTTPRQVRRASLAALLCAETSAQTSDMGPAGAATAVLDVLVGISCACLVILGVGYFAARALDRLTPVRREKFKAAYGK